MRWSLNVYLEPHCEVVVDWVILRSVILDSRDGLGHRRKVDPLLFVLAPCDELLDVRSIESTIHLVMSGSALTLACWRVHFTLEVLAEMNAS